MKLSIATAALLLASIAAQAGAIADLPLKKQTSTITVKLDENSISHLDDFGHTTDKICAVDLTSNDLAAKSYLAATASHTTFHMRAGRWCLVQPLEPMVQALRDAGGTLTLPITIELVESRYEVTEGFGEPENIGKCNRTLIETVSFDLPGDKAVSFLRSAALRPPVCRLALIKASARNPK